MKKLNKEYVLKQLNKKKILLLEEYPKKIRGIYVKMKYIPTNYIFKSTISAALRTFNLPEIDKKLKKRKIKRLSPIISHKIPFKIKCLIDGHEWYATFHNIMYRKSSCPKCGGSLKLTNTDVDNRLKKRKIKRIGEYINADTKIKWKCLIDGYEWYAKPTDVLNYNNGCPKCSCHHTLTNEEIDEKLNGTTIKRISSYDKKIKTTKFQCLQNKYHIFYRNARTAIRKPTCPYCKNKTELLIKLFIENNLKYDFFKHQYMIKSEYIKNYYLIDFCIQKQNKTFFIEYNGPHHYRPVGYNSENKETQNKNFKRQIIRDANVRKFCKENNIILLEIPYTEKLDDIKNKIKRLIN